MRPLIQEFATSLTLELLGAQLRASGARKVGEIGGTGLVLLRSLPPQSVVGTESLVESAQARYSFVAAEPFLTFCSFGSRCEIRYRVPSAPTHIQFGNPWHLLDSLMARYELIEEIDLPFPLGGCFGYWGYDLKNFVEPGLPRRAVNDLELPDCHVGFYDSLVIFDHHLGKTWIISTGLMADGSRTESRARERLEFWRTKLASNVEEAVEESPEYPFAIPSEREEGRTEPRSNLSRAEFLSRVERAQAYIRSGDIYQVNLSHRLSVSLPFSSWELFLRLNAVSPAPFAAYLDCDDGTPHGNFEITSTSPEQFLRLSGAHIQTRPIKGTRPRSNDPTRDAQLSYELQTSTKEMAELVMITDLLRNDIGKVCEFGSVQVPELVRLERFAQVQHLVSTVEGRLRPGETHFSAFASCFPGGSVTGAPKIRAMEIIDELEPISRGAYTGAIGYLGFNRESQLNITIRTAICKDDQAHFNVGAGIVADSIPAAEYDETLAKAAGFLASLSLKGSSAVSPAVRRILAPNPDVI